jgi:hypothetical protein
MRAGVFSTFGFSYLASLVTDKGAMRRQALHGIIDRM